MKPFQNILVPIDFSVHATNALQIAADIARRYEAPITVLHVWEPELFSVPDSYRLFDAGLLPRMLDHFKKQLEVSRHVLTAAGATQVDTALAQGAPYKEIVNFATAGGFDLIVIGTHGRAGLSHALLGSVAERVVRTAECAVLTARLPEPVQPQPVAERAEA